MKKEHTTKKRQRTSRTPSKNNPAKKSKIFWPYGLALFALLIFLDQYTKRMIMATLKLGESTSVLPFLRFTYTQNTGAIWGSIPDTNGLLVWISIIAFGVLVFFYDQFTTRFEKIAYTLLMVGLWGNMLDRVLFGHVIDFIDLGWWPVFNIADSCITIGITIYLLEQWRRHRKAKA
jgi:signal peptidase II